MTDISWINPTLEGRLVQLRPFEEADIQPVWEMVNDPIGNDLTATLEEFEFEQVRDWYRSREDHHDRLDLAIVEKTTDEFAGEVVLNEYDVGAKSCSFRISLRGPDWFGRGLGTEATELVVGYAFDTLALDHIMLEVLARNPRARRTYEKVGFVQTSQFVEDDETWVRMTLSRPDPGPAPR